MVSVACGVAAVFEDWRDLGRLLGEQAHRLFGEDVGMRVNGTNFSHRYSTSRRRTQCAGRHELSVEHVAGGVQIVDILFGKHRLVVRRVKNSTNVVSQNDTGATALRPHCGRAHAPLAFAA